MGIQATLARLQVRPTACLPLTTCLPAMVQETFGCGDSLLAACLLAPRFL